VQGWYAKTPADFLFARKTPQEITHDRALVNADSTIEKLMEKK
jgi:uncharacterized protein YecE (DUF72 family)